MEPIQNSDLMEQFAKLLNENGRQGQAQDLSRLLWYMDGMSRQFDAVTQELQEVKAQLAYEKQPAIQKAMEGVATNLENKLEWARDMLAGLWERIVDCAKNAIESFKDMGVTALDKVMSVMGVKNKLEVLQEHISGMIDDTKQSIEKVESIGHELRSAGGHLKNAGRAMIGKETQEVDGGQAGRFQSVVLAPMRVTQKLLTNMNNATLSAIDRVEHLERTAEGVREARAVQKAGKHLGKKPSIRQALAEKKAEIAARSAPAPEKEHKAPEASR